MVVCKLYARVASRVMLTSEKFDQSGRILQDKGNAWEEGIKSGQIEIVHK